MERSLGGYELVEEIGRGGFGLVYRARSPDGSEVAVKVLRRGGAEREARFEREIRILREVGAGFVPLLDAGETPEGVYFVMPLLRGGTLRERLRQGALPVAEVVALGRTLASTLARAHAQGVVHRDMKPENVIFALPADTGGAALVADLGLAKHVGPLDESAQLTKSHEIRGTAGYVAPEQVRLTKAAGPPADVFSLGAILYECLAGRPAFDAPNALAAIVMAENENYPPLAEARPDAPRWLVKTIERALRPEPRERFADAAALERALHEPKPRAGASPRALALLAALGVAALLVAALAVAALLGALTVTGRTPPRQPLDSRASGPEQPDRGPAPGPREWPALTSGFRETRHTRLVQVLGAYEWTCAREVLGASFSPDGRFAIAGSKEATRIFAVPSGEEERVLGVGARQVALGPGATLALVLGVEDRTLRLWTREGSRALALDPGPSPTASPASPPTAVAIAPDGARAAVGCADGSVLFLALPAGEVVERGALQASAVLGVSFSPDGKRLVVQAERTWSTFEVATLSLVGTEEPRPRTFASPDGRCVLAPCFSSLRPVELVTGRDLAPLPGHRSHVTTIATVGSGSLVVTAGYDRRILVWQLETGREVATLGGHEGTVYALAVTPDGQHVLSAGSDRRVKVWDVASGALERSFAKQERYVHAVAAAPGGLVASAGLSGRIHVWSLATAEERNVVSAIRPGTKDPDVNFLAFLDDARLVSAGTDGRLLLWRDVARRDSGEPRILADLDEPLTALAVSGARETVLLGTESGRLLACRVTDGGLRRLDARHEGPVFSAAISPDGTRVVSGGAADPRVHLSLLASGEVLDTVDLSSSRDGVHSVAWAPDGRSFLVGTLRGVVLRFETR